RPVTRSATPRARSSSGAGLASGVRRATPTSRSRQPTVSTTSAWTVARQPPAGASTVSRSEALSGRQSASFCWSRFSRVICLPSGSDAVVGPVEGKRRRLAIDEGGEMDRPPPDELYVRQGVRSLIQTEFDSGELMLEQQFSSVAIVAVYYINPRF